MYPEYTRIFGEVIERLSDRLNVSLPAKFRLLPDPEAMLDAIAESVEFELDDYENTLEIAIEENAKWRAKYFQCRKERNALFHLLKLAGMGGVITKDGISVLSEITDSLSGSDVSPAAKHSPES